MNKRVVGTEKESDAEKFLAENGLIVTKKNFRGKTGEIDLIAEDEQTIIFIEVKYRKNKKFGYGEEAISYQKRRKIYFTAQEYIKNLKNFRKDIRFDVIAINGNEINWIKNCIWGDEIGL